MKKLLLFAIGTGLWLCAGAQSSNSGAVSHREAWLKHVGRPVEGTPAGLSNFYNQGTQSRNNEGKNARTAATGTIIGTAFNAYGVLDASTTAVTYNQQTHLICMTHRENMGYAYGSGAYMPSFSTDGGNTWDSTDFILFKNQSSRYPNGVIYNPAGNTDPKQAYLVVAGPWTNNSNSSISWVKTVYGSMRFDTANRDEIILSNGVGGAQVQDNGNLSYMTACDDGRVHVIGQGYNFSGNNFTRYLGSVITTGQFNGTNFTWTQQVIRPHLYSAYLGAPPTAPYDSLAFPLGSSGTAWSQDGKTGYVVIFGNLDSAGAGFNYNFSTYQPIVYRTTDTGATWTMMPPFNFRNIPSLVQYIQGRPTADSGIPTPLWNLIGQAQGDENDYDVVVDMNGHLHIVGSIEAAFYTNNDSAYQIYSFKYPTYYLYDVYNTTPTGGWKARFIDSMQCRPGYSVNTGSPWTSGANTVNFGARIQTTRTLSGDKIFYTWEDDLAQIDTAGMQYPDIKGMGYDVAHNKATRVHTFTQTLDQYFLCVSDLPIVTGTYPNSVDSIPCVYVNTFNGNDGTSPVEFMYQAGVVYADSMFVLGEQEINNVKAGFSVSGNYPNPFNGNTYFNVTLDKESTVAVDVFNMLGEKVETISPAKMAPGVHTITLASKGMNTGVYFYRVNVNNQSITHKMVIE